MIRDISMPQELSFIDYEDDFMIPVPSICQMDMGITIAGASELSLFE
jgi:hypothetical protein